MSATDSNPDQLLTRRALKHQRTPARRRRQKILALTAGGLVLGVGATATVAAWSDETFSTDNSRQDPLPSKPILTARGRAPTLCSPPPNNGSRPPRYRCGTDQDDLDTTVDGELTVTGQGATGALGPYLEYRATATNLTAAEANHLAVNNTGCQFGFYFWWQNSYVPLDQAATADTTGTARPPQRMRSPTVSSAACSRAPNEAQDTAADHTWTFHAESIVPD